MGQVLTLVVGDVNIGDYILPSGLDDGTGIAVSAAAIQPQDLPLIIGTAWAVLEDGLVNVAIGFKAINWGDIILDNPGSRDNFELDELKQRVLKLELLIQGLLPDNAQR